MANATPSCFTFDRQPVARAFSRAWAKTGKRIAARMAMIAITTSNSIKVKPRACGLRSIGVPLSFATGTHALHGFLRSAISPPGGGGGGARHDGGKPSSKHRRPGLGQLRGAGHPRFLARRAAERPGARGARRRLCAD